MRRSNFINEHPVLYVVFGVLLLIFGIVFMNSNNAERAEEERFMSIAEEIPAQCTSFKTRETHSGRRTTVHVDGYFTYEYGGREYRDRLITDVGSDIEVGEYYYIYIDPNNPDDCRLPYTEQYKNSQSFGSWAIMGAGGVCIVLGVVFIWFKRKSNTASVPASSSSSGSSGSSYSNVFDTYSAPPESLTNDTFTGVNPSADNNPYGGYPAAPDNTFGGVNPSANNNPYGGYPAAPDNTSGGVNPPDNNNPYGGYNNP